MSNQAKEVPVFLFTGFLESGKTKFIQETLEDKRFCSGERTLLLVCEEGEEEYAPEQFATDSVKIRIVEEPEQLTRENLEQWLRETRAERVVIEYNGMWMLDQLYAAMPEGWMVYQEFLFADASTFLSYNSNMRQLVYDKLKSAELVVFNRFDRAKMDKMAFHKIVRGASRRADIAYEDKNGKVEYDDIEDPLPFDLNAPIVEIKDGDYALFYRDMSEEPQKYDGKTVRFKGQVAMLRRDKNGMFAPGRFVMTCCVEDIQFCGIPCRYAKASELKSREWVMVTAKVAAEKHPLYKGELGPVLTAIEVSTGAQPAEPDVATF